jgi:hypothetical protein
MDNSTKRSRETFDSRPSGWVPTIALSSLEAALNKDFSSPARAVAAEPQVATKGGCSLFDGRGGSFVGWLSKTFAERKKIDRAVEFS